MPSSKWFICCCICSLMVESYTMCAPSFLFYQYTFTPRDMLHPLCSKVYFASCAPNPQN